MEGEATGEIGERRGLDFGFGWEFVWRAQEREEGVSTESGMEGGFAGGGQ